MSLISTSPSSHPSDPARHPAPGDLALARRALLRRRWKQYARENAVQATDLILFSLLFGRPLHRAFTPVRSAVKLANGQRPFGAAEGALRRLTVALSFQRRFALLDALDLTEAEERALLQSAHQQPPL